MRIIYGVCLVVLEWICARRTGEEGEYIDELDGASGSHTECVLALEKRMQQARANVR